MSDTVKARVWFSEGMTYTWPEQQAGVKPNIGVCFSGGGTRAMCAAMGQLRALIDIGFMQHVDYISCVSGGSWASTAFAYYKSGATNDAELLGTPVDPQNITMPMLELMTTSSMAWGATQDLGDAIDKAHREGVKDDLLWAAAVGALFFERYGIWDLQSLPYFSLDQQTVDAIRAVNPSLANAQFSTVRMPDAYKVPYLLINATIDGPTAGVPYTTDPLMMVTYTPLYCGIPFQQSIEYINKHAAALGGKWPTVVGGGFVEPFAWGGSEPLGPVTNGLVEVTPRATPFGAASASGTSSSAFAAIFEKIKLVDGLLPEEMYWPPTATGKQPPAQLFDFGDGGNLENYGIIPVIMRGVKKIVVFINTDNPLSLTYDGDPKKTASESEVDTSLPPLFGVPTKGNAAASINQVFPQGDYTTLIQALQALKKAGQPLVHAMTHQIVRNPQRDGELGWGVPGGGSVEVLWVYLDKVDAWKDKLTDRDVRIQVDLAPTGIGDFAHFPNYKTIDENILPPWSLTELTAKQANLLAALTCWVVRQSKPAFDGLV
ncbi:MAG TPA: hypothetical protein VGF69_02340 [Thermoanaerobaculia bacterium]|jgi:hypothetical protein